MTALDEAAAPAPTAGPPRPTRHIAALDGLRAVAIVAVLCFHQGFGWAHGGYLGVDLFFVLSGFLIAGKLVDEHRASGRIDLRAFWVGRFRRLLPALLLALLGITAYAAWVAEPNAQNTIRGDVLAALLYVANWRFIFSDVGYFASTAAPSPVRHLWSLSVEEQFYLLFPLLLVVLNRRPGPGGPRRLLAPVAGLIVASTVLTAFLAWRGSTATRLYEGTDTRLATILLGVLAALAVRTGGRPPTWLRPVAAASAVVAAVIMVAARGDARWMYPWGQLSFGVASAFVVTAAASLRAGPVLRALGSRPAVALGAISYSLYLWHWPVYLVLTPDRTDLDGAALFVARVVVSVGMAVLSYQLVEQPIRQRRVRLPQPAALSVAAMVVVGVLITVVTAGAPTGDELAAPTGEKVVVTLPSIPTDLAPADLPDGVTAPPAAPTDRPLKLALVGDSAGFSLSYYKPDIPGLDITSGTIIGCGIMAPASPYPDKPPPEACPAWKETWAGALTDDPDVVLMVTGAWEINDHWLDGRELAPPSDAATTYVDGQLDQAVEVITAQTDARIAALALPCSPKLDAGVGEAAPPRTDLTLIRWFNDRLDALRDRHPGLVSIISLEDRMCPDGKAVDKVDGVRLRNDGTHWTEESAPIGWNWLLPLVFDVAYRPS